MAQHGIVATSQPLAAQAGLRILQQGGNAIDAAVATAAALGLVEPMNNGVAADLFAIVYIARDNKVYQLKSSGTAPTGASVESYQSLGYFYDQTNWGYGSGMPGGVLSAPVPGAAWGWVEAVKRFGRLDMHDVLAPAIDLAENGFPVSEVIGNGWNLPRMSACADPKRPCDPVSNPLSPKQAAGTIWPAGWKGIGCYTTNSASTVPSTANYPRCVEQDPDAIAAWYIKGVSPTPGQIYRNPDYGKTLRLLAARGVDGFYRGEVAHAIVDKIRQLGGTMTLHDLANYRGEWVEAAHSQFTNSKSVTFDIFETMAPSQAWNTGEMMNVIQACVPGWAKKVFGPSTTVKSLFDLGPASPWYWHFIVEAKKLSYQDLYKFNSDPAYTKINGLRTNEFIQKKLLDPAHAASLCNTIDITKASTPVEPGPDYVNGLGDTIYLTTADKWGNMVSWVNSNYASFGQGIVIPGYGFPMCNRLQQFTMNPTHFNRIDPHKRPYNTISAGFVSQGGVPLMTLGLMGGDMQVQGHSQMLVNILELGANVQASTDMARFYHNEVPNQLQLESQLCAMATTWKDAAGNSRTETMCQALQFLGHKGPSGNMSTSGGSVGGYQAIMFTPLDGSAGGNLHTAIPWGGHDGWFKWWWGRDDERRRGRDRDDIGDSIRVPGFYRGGSDHRKDGQAVGW